MQINFGWKCRAFMKYYFMSLFGQNFNNFCSEI